MLFLTALLPSLCRSVPMRTCTALLILLLLFFGCGPVAADPIGLPDPTALAASAIQEEDWNGVLAVSDEAIAEHQADASLLCMKGYALRKLGRYPEAVETVTEAIALDPQPVRYANRGYAYLAMGNNSAALADAETALLLDPEYAVAWEVKALALIGLNDTAGAESAIDRALILDPNSAHLWHIRGGISLAVGNTTAAITALTRSLDLDPDYSLPWPGMPDAREVLAEAEAIRAGQAASEAPLAAAPLGSLIAVVALLTASAWSARRR
jgi:tetratricopeptide (TPR) repeat protein